ncbi:MAG: DUF4271 domain-containing protein [Flavobacterium sp.]|nr:MAG: DUF4271 domain-containing protein [Flavobacterium sp.]
MSDHLFTLRMTNGKDWATVLFVVCFVLIALSRTVFEKKFADFTKLIVSDKYIKVYRDSGNLTSGFTILLFVVQVISLSFFIQLLLSHFGYASKTDWLLYIRIFTLLAVFILSKFLIEKIIATAFNIEEFVDQFNLQKVSYRTYLGLLLLPADIVLFYNDSYSEPVFYGVLFVLLTANLVTYLFSLKNYQNFILGRLFYFILYLCALEIAPYCFLYYWFTKS